MMIKVDSEHVAELHAFDLQQTAFKVYHVLISIARKHTMVDGVLFVTDSDIAAIANVSTNTTVSKCLFEIKACGYIADLKRVKSADVGIGNRVTFHKKVA
jgi:hypothetical protein